MTATLERTVTNPRDLITPALFNRLVARIVKDEQLDQALAERIMTQALAFLKACALNPGAGLSPSRMVDIGWHTFILYTREYAHFCQQVAGRFIHHSPTDDETQPPCVDEPRAGNCTSEPHGGISPISATAAAMRSAGLPVDEELWKAHSVNCSQCHQGCHDSP